MTARVIQTFVRTCADCPHCTYYSGGRSRCSITEELISPDGKPYRVGERCPLPYAGPPCSATTPDRQRAIVDEALNRIIASNQEQEWTGSQASDGYGDQGWIVRDGQYAEIARDALAQISGLQAAVGDGPAGGRFQDRVGCWCERVFDGDPTDIGERMHRFTEEAMELTRALGQSRAEAHQLVDYVHDQDHVGDPNQEMGGTLTTLAALAWFAKLDMDACAEAELARTSTPQLIAKVREKRSKRHGRGPLPGVYAPDFLPTIQPDSQAAVGDVPGRADEGRS